MSPLKSLVEDPSHEAEEEDYVNSSVNSSDVVLAALNMTDEAPEE